MKKGSPAQNIRTLLEKKSIREKEGKFVIEGPHLIEEALPDIDFLVYTQNLPVVEKAGEMGIPCYKLSEKEYKKISDVVTPQGIMAVAAIRKPSLQEISAKEKSFLIFCIDIQDPGNMGTIIRAADAAAISGIIVNQGCVDIYNQKTIRSTAGSIFHIPIFESKNIAETINELKQKQFKIIAADTSGIENFWQADFLENTLVLIGSEGAGLSEEILGMADAVVNVPIAGRAESLNAAMCASVIMYETLRQRHVPYGTWQED